jgi:Asp-tRNA(Asn)/Glu-tRNA(Gln) amidotransferase A subunit family amidase
MDGKLVRTLTPFAAARREFLDGKSSPRDYLEACIEAIEAAEPTVRAFTCWDANAARAEADRSSARYREGRPLSPIDGMVVSVKDIIDTADAPTAMNNAMFTGNMARGDAACVTAVREGGGVIIGKTVTTEFAIGRSGPTVNPHNPKHTPGGSSSGSAAGAAAGMFSAGFGTQTQGSIIRPSGFCGVCGFKPTLHALSTDGIHSLSRTHDHLGTIGQDIDDVWTLARWVSERAPQQGYVGLDGPVDRHLAPLPPTRLGILRTTGFEELTAETRGAFDERLEVLRASGIELVEPADDPALADVVVRLDEVNERSLDVLAWDLRWPFTGYMATNADDLGPRLHELLERARGLSRATYRAHLTFRAELRSRVNALSMGYDGFVLPSSSEPAPEGLDYTGRRTMLVYWSFLGLPSFSLPLMQVAGLPLGLQLAGFEGGDYRLARHAKAILQRA